MGRLGGQQSTQPLRRNDYQAPTFNLVRVRSEMGGQDTREHMHTTAVTHSQQRHPSR